MKKYMSLLIVVIVLNGCTIISHQKYPKAHKQLIQEEKCRRECIDISGTYENKNFKAEDKRIIKNTYDGNLAQMLIGLWDKEINEVVINQEGLKSIDIKAFYEGELIGSRVYTSADKDFKCKDNRIIFKTKWTDTSGAFGWLFDNKHFELTKTVNEDLALRDSGNTSGLMVIPPTPPFLVDHSDLYFFKKLK